MKLRQKLALVLAAAMVTTAVPVVTSASVSASVENMPTVNVLGHHYGYVGSGIETSSYLSSNETASERPAVVILDNDNYDATIHGPADAFTIEANAGVRFDEELYAVNYPTTTAAIKVPVASNIASSPDYLSMIQDGTFYAYAKASEEEALRLGDATITRDIHDDKELHAFYVRRVVQGSTLTMDIVPYTVMEAQGREYKDLTHNTVMEGNPYSLYTLSYTIDRNPTGTIGNTQLTVTPYNWYAGDELDLRLAYRVAGYNPSINIIGGEKVGETYGIELTNGTVLSDEVTAVVTNMGQLTADGEGANNLGTFQLRETAAGALQEGRNYRFHILEDDIDWDLKVGDVGGTEAQVNAGLADFIVEGKLGFYNNSDITAVVTAVSGNEIVMYVQATNTNTTNLYNSPGYLEFRNLPIDIDDLSDKVGENIEMLVEEVVWRSTGSTVYDYNVFGTGSTYDWTEYTFTEAVSNNNNTPHNYVSADNDDLNNGYWKFATDGAGNYIDESGKAIGVEEKITVTRSLEGYQPAVRSSLTAEDWDLVFTNAWRVRALVATEDKSERYPAGTDVVAGYGYSNPTNYRTTGNLIETLEIAEVVTSKVLISIEEQLELVAGRDSKLLTIYINEIVKESLEEDDVLTFSLSTGDNNTMARWDFNETGSSSTTNNKQGNYPIDENGNGNYNAQLAGITINAGGTRISNSGAYGDYGIIYKNSANTSLYFDVEAFIEAAIDNGVLLDKTIANYSMIDANGVQRFDNDAWIVDLHDLLDSIHFSYEVRVLMNDGYAFGTVDEEDMTVTLTAKSEEGSFEDCELVAATFISPFTVEFETIQLMTGVKAQTGGKIVITENFVGGFEDGKTLTLSMADRSGYYTNGGDFTSNLYSSTIHIMGADIEVTGDIGENAEYTASNGNLTVRLDDQGYNNLSQITIEGIEFDVLGNVARGDYDMTLTGTLVSSYNDIDGTWYDNSTSQTSYDLEASYVTLNGFVRVGEELFQERLTATMDFATNNATVNGQVASLFGKSYIDADTGRAMIAVRDLATFFNIHEDNILFASGGHVTIFTGSDVITLSNGSNIMYVSGTPIVMDQAMTIGEDERSYAPMRFVAQAMGLQVSYDDVTKVATFTNYFQN